DMENVKEVEDGLFALGFRDKPIITRFEGLSLDEYLGPDAQVDLIKIDTDGAEPYVFRGMQSLMRSKRPLTILVEYSPIVYKGLQIDPLQLLEEIVAAGFRISEFKPGEGLKPVDSLAQLTEQLWAELLLVRE